MKQKTKNKLYGLILLLGSVVIGLNGYRWISCFFMAYSTYILINAVSEED